MLLTTVAQTSNPALLDVQALIVPIVSWENVACDEDNLLYMTTGGFYHERLTTFIRHNLHQGLPMIPFRDDRVPRKTKLEYVLFVFLDEHLDRAFVAYGEALRFLVADGVESMALPLPIGVMSTAHYALLLSEMRLMLNMHRVLTTGTQSHRLVLATDIPQATHMARRKLADLQCANAKNRANNS